MMHTVNGSSMRRIVVIGTSGCGKTTLARELSQALKIPHIELDSIHWKPNWVSRPADEMKLMLDPLTAREAWTCDGNYLKVRDLVWPRANTIIWLDYSMTLIMTRCFRRTIARWWTQAELWSGNRESLWGNFCTRDSLFLWIVQSWRRHRRDYPKMFKTPECRHLRILRFRTPGELESWKRSIDLL
jgi:adenylate kinase family enzyme